jgi:hypothetical protein
MNCSTTFGTAECESTSGCQGGTADPCPDSLTGVYCRLCNRSDDAAKVFYKPATANAAAKCEACGSTIVQTVMVVVAGFAAVAFALVTVLWIWRKLPSKVVDVLMRILRTYTPEHKIKIIFVFYQIATRVHRVYEVTFPPNVVAALQTLSTVVTFGMENVATTPLECLQLQGYVPRLLFWMIFPIAGTLVIFCSVVLAPMCIRLFCAKLISRTVSRGRRLSTMSRRLSSTLGLDRESMKSEADYGEALMFHLQQSEEKQRPSNTFEKTIRVMLLIMFVLYPKVTNVAFEGFPCCERL